MFALSGLLDAAMPLPVVPRASEGFDLRALARNKYRFPIPSVSAIRLPKDVRCLADMLTAAGPDAALCWAALTGPLYRVPLMANGGIRRAALVAACADGSGIAIASATLGVQPGPRRHSPMEIVEYHLDVARDREQGLELLERVWADATPAARSAAGGAPALWLGGDPAAVLAGGDVRIAGVCATFGLQAEVVRDAGRHARQVATRIGAGPPSYLIIWRPSATGIDGVVQTFRQASAEGELIELRESALPDALLELRWALTDVGLIDRPDSGEGEPEMAPPRADEERFYIKIAGSKVGDVMIEVADCGHDQWGGDARRRAPRAHKGIAALVGVTPRALYRCAKCSKHRWRARY